MKITFYANPRVYGGLMKHLELLAAGLSPDHSVNLIIPGTMMERFSRSRGAIAGISHAVVQGKLDWSGFFRLCSALKRDPPDIFHLHLSSPGESTPALIAARLSGAPVIVVTEHAPSYFPLRKIYSRSVKRWCAGCIDRIIVLNKKSAELLTTEYSIDPAKLSVIHNGVLPVDQVFRRRSREMRKGIGIDEDSIVVATVSEIAERKGIGILLGIAEEIVKENPKVRFLLIGEGRQKAQFEEEHRSSIDAGRIMFLGYKDDVVPYLSLSDIFALPSFGEESPLALLEAMAAGLPVIATTVGGIPEIVDDMKQGILIQPEDGKALRAALSRLIEEPDLRGQLSGNALRKIDEEFSVAAMIRRTEDLYRTLLDEKGRRA